MVWTKEQGNEYSRKWRAKNPEKFREAVRKWQAKNPEKKREYNRNYITSERGYFMEMWNSIKKSKHGYDFKNFDDFFQCWLDQKAIYGVMCPATDIEMTMLRHVGRGIGAQRTPTNISKDRVLCSRKYSKQNLIFTTWEYNNSKHNISPRSAKAFLRIVKERYGTNEVERDET